MALLQEPTLRQLLREARLFLNQSDSSNSFWSDEELANYANDGVRKYFLVVNDLTEGQFDTTSTIDLVSGTDNYALPTDFFELRAVYFSQGNQNIMLRYNNNLTEGYFTDTASASGAYAPYYYFRGGSIVLRPIPGFSQTAGLLLEYTAFPQVMVTGGDSVSSGLNQVFKELVVKYMIYQAKLKESSVLGGDTYKPVQSDLLALEAQFKATAGGRSKSPQFIKPFNP